MAFRQDLFCIQQNDHQELMIIKLEPSYLAPLSCISSLHVWSHAGSLVYNNTFLGLGDIWLSSNPAWRWVGGGKALHLVYSRKLDLILLHLIWYAQLRWVPLGTYTNNGRPLHSDPSWSILTLTGKRVCPDSMQLDYLMCGCTNKW